MAKMVSPAGDMEVTFQRVYGLNKEIVVVSKFGVWDSKLYFTPTEVAHMAKLMLRPSVVGFLSIFPFLLIRSRLSKREKDQPAS